MHLLDSELRNKEDWEGSHEGMPPVGTFRCRQYLPRISCSVSAEAAERWC